LRQLNGALHFTGIQIVRHRPRHFEDFRDYIPFEETIAAAEKEGLSAGDYIETKHNRGANTTRQTIDQLRNMGVLHEGVRRICEIGPGSGRYLEKTIDICHPDRYEIYESALDWRRYLSRKYKVVAHEADGLSLAQTPSSSIDLVHAHKVFIGLPFLAAYGYFLEMVRVLAPEGKIVFDLVTEGCMREEIVKRWLAARGGYQAYPNLFPRQYVIDFFASKKLALEGAFTVANEPGETECMVFGRAPQ
jgi:hypothetical protein